LNHPKQGLLKLDERRGKRRATRIKHDIPLRTEFSPMTPEGFPKPALDPVSRHGFTNRARHSKTETNAWRFSGRRSRQTKRCEQRAGKAKASVINHSKIGRAQDPGRSRKMKRTAAGSFTWP